VKQALGRQPDEQARGSSPDVCEDFRQARTALGQITTDLERLRKQAASVVKRTHRAAK
jgi:hypothetical protein